MIAVGEEKETHLTLLSKTIPQRMGAEVDCLRNSLVLHDLIPCRNPLVFPRRVESKIPNEALRISVMKLER